MLMIDMRWRAEEVGAVGSFDNCNGGLDDRGTELEEEKKVAVTVLEEAYAGRLPELVLYLFLWLFFFELMLVLLLMRWLCCRFSC